MKLHRLRSGVLGISTGLALSGAVSAQVVDFEPGPNGLFPDGSVPRDDMSLTDQFASSGVLFGIDNNLDFLPDNRRPRLEARGQDGTDGFFSSCGPARKDSEAAAFTGALGNWFLKPSLPGVADNLLITYLTPNVYRASGEVWDIDGNSLTNEQWVVTAYDQGGSPLAFTWSPVGTTNNCSNPYESGPWTWSIIVSHTGPAIAFIRITPSSASFGSFGFAFDNFRVSAIGPCSPAECMVGWWRLDGLSCSGCARPGASRSLPGTDFTSGAAIPGIRGNGRFLDGVSDHFRVEPHPSLDFAHDDMTILAWVDPVPIPPYGPIVSKVGPSGRGYVLELAPSGRLQLTLDDGASTTLTATQPVPPGVWNQVALVLERDGAQTDVSFYLNGVLDSPTTSVPLGQITNDGPFLIGSDGAGAMYVGGLDEIAVFDRAMSAQDVLASYTDLGNWCTVCPETDCLQTLRISRFFAEDEGWTVLVTPSMNVETPVWVNGYIQRRDVENGSFYFVAPPSFDGDWSSAAAFAFDWRSDDIDAKGRNVGLSIYSGATRISAVLATTADYENDWIHYEFPFNEMSCWRYDDGAGNVQPAIPANVLAVLSSVTGITISGESRVGHGETTRLDNPRFLTCSPCGLVVGKNDGSLGLNPFVGPRWPQNGPNFPK